jgi:cell division protein ZapA (FtsZ GTPase activity inhibitor)
MNNEKTETALAETVRVHIFNQTYSLRSHSEREHVERLARLVDERMRQIASQAPVHDVVKVAILAALNIADELEHLKGRFEEQGTPQTQGTAGDRTEPSRGDDTAPAESDAQSWYEDLFDTRTAGRRSDERLSTRVSSKLQMLRQPSHDPLTIEAEEEGD